MTEPTDPLRARLDAIIRTWMGTWVGECARPIAADQAFTRELRELFAEAQIKAHKKHWGDQSRLYGREIADVYARWGVAPLSAPSEEQGNG